MPSRPLAFVTLELRCDHPEIILWPSFLHVTFKLLYGHIAPSSCHLQTVVWPHCHLLHVTFKLLYGHIATFIMSPSNCCMATLHLVPSSCHLQTVLWSHYCLHHVTFKLLYSHIAIFFISHLQTVVWPYCHLLHVTFINCLTDYIISYIAPCSYDRHTCVWSPFSYHSSGWQMHAIVEIRWVCGYVGNTLLGWKEFISQGYLYLLRPLTTESTKTLQTRLM